MQTCPECGSAAPVSPCDACGHVWAKSPSEKADATAIGLTEGQVALAPAAIDLPASIDLGETTDAPATPSAIPPPIDLAFLSDLPQPVEASASNADSPDAAGETLPASVDAVSPETAPAPADEPVDAEPVPPGEMTDDPPTQAKRFEKYSGLKRIAPWQLVLPEWLPPAEPLTDSSAVAASEPVSADELASDATLSGATEVGGEISNRLSAPAADGEQNALLERPLAVVEESPATVSAAVLLATAPGPAADDDKAGPARESDGPGEIKGLSGAVVDAAALLQDATPDAAQESASANADAQPDTPRPEPVPHEEKDVSLPQPAQLYLAEEPEQNESSATGKASAPLPSGDNDTTRGDIAPDNEPAASAILSAESLLADGDVNDSPPDKRHSENSSPEPLGSSLSSGPENEAVEPLSEAPLDAASNQIVTDSAAVVHGPLPVDESLAAIEELQKTASDIPSQSDLGSAPGPTTRAQDGASSALGVVRPSDPQSSGLLSLIESELFETLPPQPADDEPDDGEEEMEAPGNLVVTAQFEETKAIDFVDALAPEDPEEALLVALGNAGQPTAKMSRTQSTPKNGVYTLDDEEEDPEEALLAILGAIQKPRAAKSGAASLNAEMDPGASEEGTSPPRSENAEPNLADLLEPDGQDATQTQARPSAAAANEDNEHLPEVTPSADDDRAEPPDTDETSLPDAGVSEEITSEPFASLRAELQNSDVGSQISVLARHLAELEERAKRAERRNRFLQERLKVAEERVDEAEKQSKRATSMVSRLEQIQDDIAVLKNRSRSRLQIEVPAVPADDDEEEVVDTSAQLPVQVDEDLNDAVESFFGPSSSESAPDSSPDDAGPGGPKTAHTDSGPLQDKVQSRDAESEENSTDDSVEDEEIVPDNTAEQNNEQQTESETQAEEKANDDDDDDDNAVEIISSHRDTAEDEEEAEVSEKDASDLASVLGFETDDEEDAPKEASVSVPVGPPPGDTGKVPSLAIASGDSLEDRVNAYVAERAESMRLNAEDEGIRETLEIEFFSKEVAEALRKEGAPNLRMLSERLRDLKPDDPTALAGIGYCRFIESPTPAGQEDALRELREAQDRFPKAADVHLATGTALFTQGRLLPARGALRMAAQLRPGDPRVTSLVKKIDAQKNKKGSKQGERQGVAAVQSMLFASLIIGVLVFVSVLLEFGIAEDVYNPAQPFWLVRRGVLLLGAVAGILIFDSRRLSGIGARIRFDTDFRTFLLCIGGGCTLGFLTGVGDVLSTGLPAALGCAFVTVTVERFFFSAFLTEDVLEMNDNPSLVVLMTAPIYAAYMVLTYSSSWEHLKAMPVLLCIFAGFGALFSAIHAWTRSTVLVWLTELTITITAIVMYSQY